jgi:hypothetical protein
MSRIDAVAFMRRRGVHNGFGRQSQDKPGRAGGARLEADLAAMLLEAVRIVGYVGKDDDEALGKMYMRSRWLIVEFSDCRRAYLMPRAIVSLLESAKV